MARLICVCDTFFFSFFRVLFTPHECLFFFFRCGAYYFIFIFNLVLQMQLFVYIYKISSSVFFVRVRRIFYVYTQHSKHIGLPSICFTECVRVTFTFMLLLFWFYASTDFNFLFAILYNSNVFYFYCFKSLK